MPNEENVANQAVKCEWQIKKQYEEKLSKYIKIPINSV